VWREEERREEEKEEEEEEEEDLPIKPNPSNGSTRVCLRTPFTNGLKLQSIKHKHIETKPEKREPQIQTTKKKNKRRRAREIKQRISNELGESTGVGV
jgi:hypothetical protein